ncbi:hypothetical protein D5274_12565 [bacterium 1XD42-94]|nr:hypothetical protein [bacterium 1XD42-76]NBK05955.1 hypothetical protein [bacterium 1XD42-94]
MDILFLMIMAVLILLGAFLVFRQLLSAFLLNGALAVSLKAWLFKPACAVSATVCMLSFFMHYFKPKEK